MSTVRGELYKFMSESESDPTKLGRWNIIDLTIDFRKIIFITAYYCMLSKQIDNMVLM